MPVILYTPKRHLDQRGWFSETYNAARFKQAGIMPDFCQDNQSFSAPKFTLRGLHYQTPPMAQDKLVRVLSGAIFDVAVDIRQNSPTYGKWVGAKLTAEHGEQLFIPIGFAHGFMTLEENTMVAYKVSNFYSAENDGGIHYSSVAGLTFPSQNPILSDKDVKLPPLSHFKSPFTYDGSPLTALSTGLGNI